MPGENGETEQCPSLALRASGISPSTRDPTMHGLHVIKGSLLRESEVTLHMRQNCLLHAKEGITPKQCDFWGSK